MGETSALLARGSESLAAGDFVAARDAFAQAAADSPDGVSLDGLAEALWWLGEVETAVDVRGRSYAAHARNLDFEMAARAAAWVAREKRAQRGEGSVPRGWRVRAREAAERAPQSSALGWVLVAEAESSADVVRAAADYDDAIAAAKASDDVDLECLALARRGLLVIGQADPDQGIRDLDSAMASVASGAARERRTLAEVYCALVDATELLGGGESLTQWSDDLMRTPRLDLGPLAGEGAVSAQATLSAFCGSCCGGIFLAIGRLDEAEEALLAAIAALDRSGLRSRCVHPRALLADLRTVQGRLDEASALLAPIADLPEAVRPLAALYLALGNAPLAVSRLSEAVRQLPRGAVASLPLLTMLVDALLAEGDVTGADRVAVRISGIAARTRSPRHAAEAHLAAGKTTLLADPASAAVEFRAAMLGFSAASRALPASRARLLFARAIAHSDPGSAVAEARAARAAFHRMGSTVDTDEASAFLRSLGVATGPGERTVGQLSSREQEVMRLVAEGLSNPEIAERLFISRRTAGHHVSSILQKLGLRSRTEIAAFAVVSASQVGAGPQQE
ncbi:helix-turn-helix transcriptional regulator [Agromyces mariniharenae]|nr:helix-turn-helix transcriptional regulator [Agromyces mariniharenae]